MADRDSSDASGVNASRIAKLFDIRLIVGGLLSLYGLVLLITGLVNPGLEPSQKSATAAHTAGQHLNTWTGVGMLVVGLAMLAWMRLRPLEPLKPGDLDEDGPAESRAE